MRGYGESDRPSEIADYTLNNMVEDIRALVPALGRYLMYIHSMGELVIYCLNDSGNPALSSTIHERPKYLIADS